MYLCSSQFQDLNQDHSKQIRMHRSELEMVSAPLAFVQQRSWRQQFFKGQIQI